MTNALITHPRFGKMISVVNGCHVWRGGTPSSYPTAHINGKTVKMNRIVFEMFCGEIPKGAHICHRCDNPRCVNPEHLFAGTVSDNMRDMVAKGRQSTIINSAQDHFPEGHAPRGEKASGSILSQQQAEAILRRRAEGELTSALASEYGVSRTSIQRLLRGDTWIDLIRPPMERPSGRYARNAGRAALAAERSEP